jgi:hypothetical protein
MWFLGVGRLSGSGIDEQAKATVGVAVVYQGKRDVFDRRADSSNEDWRGSVRDTVLACFRFIPVCVDSQQGLISTFLYTRLLLS